MRFEWDTDKAAHNLSNHGVTFDEARTVFGDRLARTDPDPAHSQREERRTTLGVTERGRLVIVWHADRVDEGEEVIRIIGARPVTPQERRAYESEP